MLDNLDQLFEAKYGWLSPEKEIIPVRFHEHFAFLATRPELAEHFTRYDDTVRYNEESMQEDLDSLGPDEHPAMHRFDGMNSDAQEILINQIYTRGWLRLGFHMESQYQYPNIQERISFIRKHQDDPTQFTLEAEGFAEHIKGHRSFLNRIRKKLGCELKPSPIRYERTKYHRDGQPGYRVPDR